MHEAPRLARELGIGRLLIKRDDLTGLAFGGNKARNLEFRMAEAVQQGAEVFIAGLEAQSNSARQSTAAANVLGMHSILILRTDRDGGRARTTLLGPRRSRDERPPPSAERSGVRDGRQVGGRRPRRTTGAFAAAGTGVCPRGLEAMRLAARTEGLILDPVYTGKAMAGLIDHARRGLFDANSTVVFIHTGGLPAMFAFSEEILRSLPA